MAPGLCILQATATATGIKICFVPLEALCRVVREAFGGGAAAPTTDRLLKRLEGVGVVRALACM